VYRNGDSYYKGIDVAVNTRNVHTINQLLDELSEKIGLLKGVKALYTLEGNLVTSTEQLENRQEYVASSGGFIQNSYGKHSNTPLDASRRSGSSSLGSKSTRRTLANNNRSLSRPEKGERKSRKSDGAINSSEKKDKRATPDKEERKVDSDSELRNDEVPIQAAVDSNEEPNDRDEQEKDENEEESEGNNKESEKRDEDNEEVHASEEPEHKDEEQLDEENREE